jgi:dTDP-4-amino-4,6-dideoxygalactose transaminase
VTEFEGALGCAEMSIVRPMIKKRQKNAAYLIKGLEPLQEFLQLPWHPPHTEHAFMIFPIVIKEGKGIKKSDLIHFIEKKGVETRDLMPLINQPYILEMFKHDTRHFPTAHWINEHGFYIGCHQKMKKPELDFIIKCFFDFINKHRATHGKKKK